MFRKFRIPDRTISIRDNDRIPNNYMYDTTTICTMISIIVAEAITSCQYAHKLELVNVRPNQTEPLCILFFEYKYTTNEIICLLKIIILDTNNVLH